MSTLAPVLIAVLLAASSSSLAEAQQLYGATASGTMREYGGLSEQPSGAVVTIDPDALGAADDQAGFSMNPGGTTLLVDAFDPPAGFPEDGWLLGLTWSDGRLYATSAECADDFCDLRPSRLIEIDPISATAFEIGPILEGSEAQNIEDLATQPGTDIVYGISGHLDFNDPASGCSNCLFTIDPPTGLATRVGIVTVTMFREPLGLAFAPDGTLYATTFPDLTNRTARVLTLDPGTAATLAEEDVLLEQQFIQQSGGQSFLITSVSLYGLAVDAAGRLVGNSANGVTQLYERVRGIVKDPNGVPVTGEETWVWRVIGDSGEDISDVAFEPTSGTTDSDGDGVPDDQDVCPGGDDTIDLDGDGTPDFCDACPNDAGNDADGDGFCGDVDTCPGGNDSSDVDEDGTPDFCDVCPNDPANDADGDEVCGDVDVCPGGNDGADADGDGIPDFCDACPNDPANDADGDNVCGNVDVCAGGDDRVDGDADGTPDSCDVCPADPDDDADDDGVCGDADICPGGNDNLDDDGDGVPDACDPCPTDPQNDADGDGFCGDVDTCPGGDDGADADEDGTANFCDVCPIDPENDADGDGVCESDDNCPLVNNPNQSDLDMDGIGDACEADTDADGVGDGVDNCPFDFNPFQEDLDGDDIGDACDTDLDGDGVSDFNDACVPTPMNEVVDADGCSIPELVPCEHPLGGSKWKNHGAYVSTVAHVARNFVDAGLITEAEKDAIVSEAGQSSCGKKK